MRKIHVCIFCQLHIRSGEWEQVNSRVNVSCKQNELALQGCPKVRKLKQECFSVCGNRTNAKFVFM